MIYSAYSNALICNTISYINNTIHLEYLHIITTCIRNTWYSIKMYTEIMNNVMIIPTQ